MATPHRASPMARFGRIFGLTALGVGGVAATVYAVSRVRRHRASQELWKQPPTEAHRAADPDLQIPLAAQPEDPDTEAGLLAVDNDALQSSESLDASSDPMAVPTSTAAWESWTVEQLYHLAQQHDIAGRSSMRKAELIAALREAGATHGK